MAPAAGARPPGGEAPIALLPPEVAARIAAGEVIERPASVLKELVENALDAGARRVEVEIEGGGIELLRVRDDGRGIPPEQLADAFERHATSKLRTERDLFAVRTLGFRGEALAAIAAAADVELVTRPAGQPAAARARYRDGRPAGRGSAAAAPGTSVTVRELFAALPARRRFLRGAGAETRAVARTLSELALAWPQVAFRLRSDGRATLSTPGGGELRDAVSALYGAEVAAALLELAGERRSEGAAARVSGVAAAPSLHRSSRRYLAMVANGRVVQPGALAHAVEQGYRGLLPAGRHPLAVVRVEVPPEQIDVNVHPAKTEVRFRHERVVFAAVTAAVRRALLAAPAPAAPALAAPPARALLAGARGARPSPDGEPASPPLAPPEDHAAEVDIDEGADPDGGQRALPLRERLPALRALGQIELSYLAAEAPDGLYLVDQHAAHERVQYERLLRSREAGRAESQPLLQSSVAPLGASLLALASERAPELAALGWELAPTDGGALMVRAVPALLADRDPARALADYLERLEAEGRLDGADRAAATLACHAAVRAGDRLEGEQQRALLRALEQVQAPLTCPHGRPTVLHLSSAAIERSFGRR